MARHVPLALILVLSVVFAWAQSSPPASPRTSTNSKSGSKAPTAERPTSRLVLDAARDIELAYQDNGSAVEIQILLPETLSPSIYIERGPNDLVGYAENCTYSVAYLNMETGAEGTSVCGRGFASRSRFSTQKLTSGRKKDSWTIPKKELESHGSTVRLFVSAYGKDSLVSYPSKSLADTYVLSLSPLTSASPIMAANSLNCQNEEWPCVGDPNFPPMSPTRKLVDKIIASSSSEVREWGPELPWHVMSAVEHDITPGSDECAITLKQDHLLIDYDHHAHWAHISWHIPIAMLSPGTLRVYFPKKFPKNYALWIATGDDKKVILRLDFSQDEGDAQQTLQGDYYVNGVEMYVAAKDDADQLAGLFRAAIEQCALTNPSARP